jgi:uncharacterized membrane protein YgcG
MKLNRLIMVSLVGISLSTPAWACEHSGGGIFSFFHHCDHDQDKDNHDHDRDKDKNSHHDCSGGSHSGGGSSSGGGGGSTSGGGSTAPTKGTV